MLPKLLFIHILDRNEHVSEIYLSFYGSPSEGVGSAMNEMELAS